MSCNEIVLVPLIIGGFLALDRKIFGHATILLMFIMILNSFLKSIFQNVNYSLSRVVNDLFYLIEKVKMNLSCSFDENLRLFRMPKLGAFAVT